MDIKKIHYFAGVIISIFISMHLFNHFMSIFGIESHIDIMKNFRLVYRNFLVEIVLILLIAIQMISGIRLVIDKKKSSLNGFEKLQLLSGLYLGIFFIIHLSAVISGRLVLNLDTNIYFGVAGLNTYPFNIFFIPYYGLAIISIFVHIASIHYKKMKLKIFGITPKLQSISIIVFGLLFTIVTFFGLTNHFQGVQIPKEYWVLIGK